MAREGLSRGDRLVLVAGLAAAGAAVAAYLTWQWYAAVDSPWCSPNEFFNCDTVRKSVYAAVAGVPTATVGLAGFLILLVLSILGLMGWERLGPLVVDAWILAFSSLGAGVGFILTLIEVLVIHAVCVLCAAGFALDLGILGVAVLLRRSPVSAIESD